MQTAAKVAIAIIIIVLVIGAYLFLKKPSFPEGSILRCSQDGGIYRIENGMKRHFTPAGWAALVPQPAAIDTDCAVIAAIPEGALI